MSDEQTPASIGRKKRAARRVGFGARCSRCAETRPEALIAQIDPLICAACQRQEKGLPARDDHHVAGQANSDATVNVPVNDHRAELSPAQYEWPKQTLQNPDGSPLLALAASVRGFIDTLIYLVKSLLLGAALALEMLDDYVKEQKGPTWWVGTELEAFAPRR